MGRRPPLIAVCGTSLDEPRALRDATDVGELLAGSGAVVVCGGLGGVMAAVARGVRQRGGTTIGLLPGADADDANADITIAVPTAMGEMRNLLIARAARALIAIGGGYGTLSEIGFALRLGRPVAGLHTWSIQRAGDDAPDAELHRVETAREAVEWVMERV